MELVVFDLEQWVIFHVANSLIVFIQDRADLVEHGDTSAPTETVLSGADDVTWLGEELDFHHWRQFMHFT